MKNLFSNKKKLALIIVSLLVVAGVLFMVVGRASLSNKAKGLIDNEEEIQAVDPSVKVALFKGDERGSIVIAIENAPEGTKNTDILVTYKRKPTVRDEIAESELITDGFQTSCKFKSGSRSCSTEDQDNLLGTCSSGRCIYYEVVGKVQLEVLFIGSYGKRIFEKEYEL